MSETPNESDTQTENAVNSTAQTVSEATSSPSDNDGGSTHRFEAEVEQVLRLVINSLYSNKEIFLRELLSNASDALDKLRFRGVTEPSLMPEGELKVQIETDAVAKTLTIADNGIGMSKDELVRNLGTIAKSGSRELLEKLKAAGSTDINLIGQFGVGFYSSFLVADRVEVISRAAGSDEAWRWESEAKHSFTVAPSSRESCGTSVILHLDADQLDLLRTWKIEELIRKYSDYLSWPIEVKMEREKDKDGPAEWRRINKGQAIWQRSASDVTKEQHEEFYKHLSHDWEGPLAWRHFKVEGMQEFSGVLYIPKRAPFDLFSPDPKHGVRLYVKRVFIMEDCDQVLPRWLRFVRGVVDSEDLPLNVSREILQDSRLTKVIRKQVIKQTLDMLAELADKQPDDYAEFWKLFGAVLKEGLHYEPEQVERLSKLLRYESSRSEKPISLAEYKSRMKEGQSGIYYAIGESRRQIESSPHLESLRKHETEVLYMLDPIDSFAVQSMSEFDGTPLKNASSADVEASESEGDSSSDENKESSSLKALRDRARQRLQEHISEVRVSHRLIDSPACLVIPEGGLQPHLERILRAHQDNLPTQKRILEVNPAHPMIVALDKLIEQNSEQPDVDQWIDLLFDQARIAEGTPLEDRGRFARSFTDLLTRAVVRSAEQG